LSSHVVYVIKIDALDDFMSELFLFGFIFVIFSEFDTKSRDSWVIVYELVVVSRDLFGVDKED
jgi:hypothetical protein